MLLRLIPLLASRFSKLSQLKSKGVMGKFITWFEGMIKSFENSMGNALKWSFNHKAIVLSVTAALFFGSFALVGGGFIGTEFVAAGDRGEFTVEVELPQKSHRASKQPADPEGGALHFKISRGN
ncbi:MAG: efflux RND transporter permease subunit [Owenweeksia sp.]|nr:efflux RND transporter permease subunit [Owenweeksia sp.]